MKKATLVIFIITIAIMGSYLFKAIIGIDIFETYSLSEYFPFKYLTGGLIVIPESGETIIDESFNSKSLFKKNWWLLWMREEGKVSATYDLEGINNSGCLAIKSNSEKKWSYSYRKFIKVQKGDVFRLEGYAKIKDKDLSVAISIASYDKDKKVINLNSEKVRINRNNQFDKATKSFTIGDGIGFIRFRIIGSGVGEAKLDNMNLRKLKNDNY